MKSAWPERIFSRAASGANQNRAIDLGERLLPPTLRRPFHLEAVRLERSRVEIALDRPGRDDLAASLRDLAERAIDAVRPRRAELLLELALGDGKQVPFPNSYSPFGIDQAPKSFLAQNGPPGCTSRSSSASASPRYIRMPALRLCTNSPLATAIETKCLR